jgi:hypothetical protein
MAYRNLPLKPEEYHLFGFRRNSLYCYDKCLSMGCASSCQIFERLSTGLHLIEHSFMLQGVMFHILDDFLIVAQTKELTDYYLKTFFAYLQRNMNSNGT